jgi:hypothetical protein
VIEYSTAEADKSMSLGGRDGNRYNADNYKAKFE